MASITDAPGCFLKIHIAFCGKMNGPLSQEICAWLSLVPDVMEESKIPHDTPNHKTLEWGDILPDPV